MKYALCAGVLWIAIGSGCVSNHENVAPAKETPAERVRTPACPRVSAGDVNPDNAHAMSQALWDELDRQSENEAPGATVTRKK